VPNNILLGLDFYLTILTFVKEAIPKILDSWQVQVAKLWPLLGRLFHGVEILPLLFIQALTIIFFLY